MSKRILYHQIDHPQHPLVQSLPSEPGTYALILKLSGEKSINIGKLGRPLFQPGFYVYIGSAFGPGGLHSRVGRHGKSIKKCRWHIDYLRKNCSLIEVWFSVRPINLECVWAEAFSQFQSISSPVKKFGSSDCSCFTHLFYAESKPTTKIIGKAGKL